MTEVITPFRRRTYLPVSSLGQRYLFTGTGRRRLNPSGSSEMPGRNSYRRSTARRTRLGKGRTRTLYKRKYTRDTGGILGGTNADTRLVYRKKRMPRKSRKRWTNFVRKVNAVDERDLGSRTVLFNDQINTGYSASTQQGCLTLALYSGQNPTKGWLDDLNQIGALENAGNPTAAAGATIAANTKMMFQTAVMDITLRNTSTFNNGTSDVQVSEAALELDVYEVIMRKDTNDRSTPFNSLSDMLNAYDDPEIGGTGSGISIQDRGATPFEFGAQIGRFGVKILKKTKYFIPNGQTITWQIRDPKRHTIRYGELTVNDGWNVKGWTRAYFLIYKLVPGLTAGTTAGTYKGNLTVGSTRKYMYKVEGFNEPRERLLGASYVPGNPT